MKKTAVIFCVLLLGCLTAPEVKKEKCTGDKVVIDGLCCLDYDKNGKCDESEALENLDSLSLEGCITPKIKDPRHPMDCCLDADSDGKCDYLKNLL